MFLIFSKNLIILGTLVPQPNNILLSRFRGSYDFADRPLNILSTKKKENLWKISCIQKQQQFLTYTMVNPSSKNYRGVCILKQSFTNLVLFDTITSFIYVHCKIKENDLDCKESIGWNNATDCNWKRKDMHGLWNISQLIK